MKDMILVGGLVVAFALFVTAHVSIVWGLLFRAPRWRALVALVVAPLALYWAIRERMKVRAGLWIASLVLYGITRVLASV